MPGKEEESQSEGDASVHQSPQLVRMSPLPPTGAIFEPTREGDAMSEVAATDASLSRRSFVAAATAGVVLPWTGLLQGASTPADLTQENLHYASVTTLAQAIRTKKVSSVEVLDACIKRIDAVNKKINALVQPTLDAAREAARKADAAVARGATLG